MVQEKLTLLAQAEGDDSGEITEGGATPVPESAQPTGEEENGFRGNRLYWEYQRNQYESLLTNRVSGAPITSFSMLGRLISRLDAVEKVTGKLNTPMI